VLLMRNKRGVYGPLRTRPIEALAGRADNQAELDQETAADRLGSIFEKHLLSVANWATGALLTVGDQQIAAPWHPCGRTISAALDNQAKG
jgi:hypothetical protein